MVVVVAAAEELAGIPEAATSLCLVKEPVVNGEQERKLVLSCLEQTLRYLLFPLFLSDHHYLEWGEIQHPGAQQSPRFGHGHSG